MSQELEGSGKGPVLRLGADIDAFEKGYNRIRKKKRYDSDCCKHGISKKIKCSRCYRDRRREKEEGF